MSTPRGVLIEHARVLAEADPRVDAARRVVALRRHAHLVRWLKARVADHTAGQIVSDNSDGIVVAIQWSDIFGRDPGPDWIAFHPPTYKYGGALATMGGGVTELRWRMWKAVPGVDGLRAVLTDIKRPDIRDSFVHEYIHWMDKQRGAEAHTGDVLATQGFTHYYREPVEFNSFFQQGATHHERHIRGLLRSPMMKHPRGAESIAHNIAYNVPRTAQEFTKNVASGLIDSWDSGFVKAMVTSPRWKRKFYARLAGLHRYLRKKYGGAIVPLEREHGSFMQERVRDYKREYREYHARPEQRRNRSTRNKARRALGIKVGDPREVDHRRPLSKGGGNGHGNLRAVSFQTNRRKGNKRESYAPRPQGVLVESDEELRRLERRYISTGNTGDLLRWLTARRRAGVTPDPRIESPYDGMPPQPSERRRNLRPPTPCPTCGAPPLYFCRTRAGRISRTTHDARPFAWQHGLDDQGRPIGPEDYDQHHPLWEPGVIPTPDRPWRRLSEAQPYSEVMRWRKRRAHLDPKRGRARIFKWKRGVELPRNMVALGMDNGVWYSPDVVVHAQLYDELELQGITQPGDMGVHYFVMHNGELKLS